MDFPFKCDICDKQFRGFEIALSHAISDKHKRQLRYAEELKTVSSGSSIMVGDYDLLYQNAIEPSSSSSCLGRCLICSVSISDVSQALSHIGSKKHKQNMDWYQRVCAAKVLGKYMSSQDRCNVDASCSFDKIVPPSDFIIADEVCRFIQTLPEGIFVREWDYFCRVCESRCMTDDHMIQHSESHSHHTMRGLRKVEHRIHFPSYRETDWKSAVNAGDLPAPPLNRRPIGY